ncbi:OmpW/AlkL family protein [Aquabacterium parvum]|uniref:OmpW/AlkL family protein n=1 Tax=Aquabacterium parvum TaxID=70584 RepID=UPI000718FB92|nr:OmpW family outer membrane protein [Aquabacterium parvum]
MPSIRFGFPQLAVIALAACAAMPVSAQQQTNSIFPTGWDSSVRSRLFMRIGYTSAFTRTKSEDAKDVTGFATSRADINAALDLGKTITDECDAGSRTGADCARYADGSNGFTWDTLARAVLEDAFVADGVDGIGTPAGIKARAQKNLGTPTVSVGYWLDDDRKWLLEGFVLAMPMSVKIHGEGTRWDGSPNSVNGKHIATTKLLPPLVIGSYSFGDAKTWPVRPYVGVGVMYAIFFGAKTTPFFDSYVGGKTTISTKNVFGAGPFVGLQAPLNDSLHFNISVGQVGLRANSRLVTSNTTITSGAAVLTDLSRNLSEAVANGDSLLQGDTGDNTVGGTTLITELVARNKGQANLGTFVREQKMKITNTIVTVSVGYNF